MPKSPRPVLVLAAAACVAVGCYEYTGPGPARDLRLTGAWAFDPAVPSGRRRLPRSACGGGNHHGHGPGVSLLLPVRHVHRERRVLRHLPIVRIVHQIFAWGFRDVCWTGVRRRLVDGDVDGRQFDDAGSRAPSIGSSCRRARTRCRCSARTTPPRPGYIVEFQDSVDAAAEAARLADALRLHRPIACTRRPRRASPRSFRPPPSPCCGARARSPRSSMTGS